MKKIKKLLLLIACTQIIGLNIKAMKNSGNKNIPQHNITNTITKDKKNQNMSMKMKTILECIANDTKDVMKKNNLTNPNNYKLYKKSEFEIWPPDKKQLFTIFTTAECIESAWEELEKCLISISNQNEYEDLYHPLKYLISIYVDYIECFTGINEIKKDIYEENNGIKIDKLPGLRSLFKKIMENQKLDQIQVLLI